MKANATINIINRRIPTMNKSARTLQVKSPATWKSLALGIDPSFTVDLSKMPTNDMTAQEFRGFSIDAGATYDDDLAPLDALVIQYGN